MNKLKENLSIFLGLFTSSATLLCCALPAVFVFLGAGSVFASLTSSIPALIWLSERKTTLFFIAGFFISLAYFFEYKNKKIYCSPGELNCEPIKKWSKYILRISIFIYFIGFFFAYLLPFFF